MITSKELANVNEKMKKVDLKGKLKIKHDPIISPKRIDKTFHKNK